MLVAVAPDGRLDGAEIPLHVQRIHALLPGAARLLFVGLREHHLGERDGGLEISALRADPRNRGLKVIFNTGVYHAAEAARAAAQAGADAFFEKPFDSKDLVSVAKRLVAA